MIRVSESERFVVTAIEGGKLGASVEVVACECVGGEGRMKSKHEVRIQAMEDSQSHRICLDG